MNKNNGFVSEMLASTSIKRIQDPKVQQQWNDIATTCAEKKKKSSATRKYNLNQKINLKERWLMTHYCLNAPPQMLSAGHETLICGFQKSNNASLKKWMASYFLCTPWRSME